MSKRTEFERLLILDAWGSRHQRMLGYTTETKAWYSGIQNGDLFALRLFRKHKKEGRL
jgi:hypothetical protein